MTNQRNEDLAEDMVEDMEFYITHQLGGEESESTYRMWDGEYWKCFQCGATFQSNQEEEAREHFGTLPPSMPACWFGKEFLIALLRSYEAKNRALLDFVGELMLKVDDDEDD